ncbi:MAG TPA: hypothetical protein VGE93_11360, partial [Bryobacteraceae bacterium]
MSITVECRDGGQFLLYRRDLRPQQGKAHLHRLGAQAYRYVDYTSTGKLAAHSMTLAGCGCRVLHVLRHVSMLLNAGSNASTVILVALGQHCHHPFLDVFLTQAQCASQI